MQVLATVVFGVVPLIVPKLFTDLIDYSGDDELIYRLAGAAIAVAASLFTVLLIWVGRRGMTG